MSIVSNVSFGDSRVFIQPEWKKSLVKECVEKSGHAPFVYNGSLRGERRVVSCRDDVGDVSTIMIDSFMGSAEERFSDLRAERSFIVEGEEGRGQALHDIFWC